MVSFGDFCAQFQNHEALLLIEPKKEEFEILCNCLQALGYTPWDWDWVAHGWSVYEHALKVEARGFPYIAHYHTRCTIGMCGNVDKYKIYHTGQIDLPIFKENNQIINEALSLLGD